jgi:uncharacterized membrane protein
MVSFVWPIILVLNAVVIILLAVFVIWKVQKDKRAGYPMKDERILKIQGKAAIGTFWINTVFMVSILVWGIVGDEFLRFPELETGWTVIAIMLVSAMSFALLSWYYVKKGEF